jgi:hypothetical protein
VIVLAKAGLLELVEAMCEQLLLPAAVADELLAGPEGDPARNAILAGWGKRISPHSVPRNRSGPVGPSAARRAGNAPAG